MISNTRPLCQWRYPARSIGYYGTNSLKLDISLRDFKFTNPILAITAQSWYRVQPVRDIVTCSGYPVEAPVVTFT